ncbi:S1 RNA-binding domain-containing protein [Patescibacteria group bacterium]|nr:S1 RNA-binding domain-containing protein [Patescibacteria group bacterium]
MTTKKSSDDTPAKPVSGFAKLLDAAEPPVLQVGEVLDATIIAKSKNEIWVDLGGVATGYVPAREIGDGRSFDSLKEGDAIHASVVNRENDDGYVVLSIKRAARDRTWVDLAALFETKDSFPAKVLEANTGGLLMDVSGVRGFLPVSQLAPEHYPRVSGGDRDLILEKLGKFVNNDLTVQILDFNQTDNKLILSEKLARTKETEANLSKYEVGDVVKGKVTGVVDFGAFVSFAEGLEGLVHISEIDWNRVDDPRQHVKVGDEIEAKIISIEGPKVSLSLKRMKDDPWVKAAEKYKPGQKVKGKIARATPFGAFVELDEDVSGLVHVSELSEEHVENPLDVVKIGDEMEFLVLEIDANAHRIALSVKGLTDPEKAVKERQQAASKPAVDDVSKLSAGVLKKLSDAGYGDMAKLKAATIEDLEAVPGIGKVSAEKIKKTLG